jgi:glucosamine kinase
MLLIADSGSTKTDWVLADKGRQVLSERTIGYNPYFIDTEGIKASIESELAGRFDAAAVSEVHFYGSGCGTPEKIQVVEKALGLCFPKAKLNVDHDLLGAARALLGDERGFAAILGTGTNTCIYNGKGIEHNIDSLGYLLGDEGSGAYIGRLVLSSWMRGYLPAELDSSFRKLYPFQYSDILFTLYNKPFPNRFLASFCQLAAENPQHPYIVNLIRESFEAFFSKLVLNYPGYKDLPLNCVGSVGHGFREVLSATAAAHGMKTGKIIRSAIEGLMEYHNIK